MKKLVIIAIIVCMVLSSCSNDSNLKQSEEDTITLRILSGKQTVTSTINLRHEEFKKKHPNVTLEYIDRPQDMDPKTFMDKISVETMAGKGPDLYILSEYQTGHFDNVYKVMQAGAFTDLNEFISADADFKTEDYSKAALDACKTDGKQFLMPIGISTPYYMSTERILKEINFDVSKAKDIQGVMSQLDNYYKERALGDVRSMIGPYYTFLPSYMNYINSEKQTVNVNTPQMRAFCETLKEINKEVWNCNYNTDENAQYLSDNKIGILQWHLSHSMLDIIAQLPETEKPVIFPTYNNEGKLQAVITDYCAVSSTSKYKQIAYDYMMLVSRHSNVDKADLVPPDSNPETFDLLEARSYHMVNEYLPVYKPAYNFQLDTYFQMNVKGYIQSTLSSEGSGVKVNPLDNNIKDSFKTLLDDVEVCSVYTDGNKLLFEYLKPYFEGSQSIEACLEDAQSAMEIHMTE